MKIQYSPLSIQQNAINYSSPPNSFLAFFLKFTYTLGVLKQSWVCFYIHPNSLLHP